MTWTIELNLILSIDLDSIFPLSLGFSSNTEDTDAEEDED